MPLIVISILKIILRLYQVNSFKVTVRTYNTWSTLLFLHNDNLLFSHVWVDYVYHLFNICCIGLFSSHLWCLTYSIPLVLHLPRTHDILMLVISLIPYHWTMTSSRINLTINNILLRFLISFNSKTYLITLNVLIWSTCLEFDNLFSSITINRLLFKRPLRYKNIRMSFPINTMIMILHELLSSHLIFCVLLLLQLHTVMLGLLTLTDDRLSNAMSARWLNCNFHYYMVNIQNSIIFCFYYKILFLF